MSTRPLATWAEIKAETSCHTLRLIAGTDEVGRGPLAGPVVAAVVAVAPTFMMDGLTDSKALNRAQREHWFDVLTHSPEILYAISLVPQDEIDRINILQSSLLAMRLAFESLRVKPELLFVDGNRPIPLLKCQQRTVVKGDAIVPAISAASIIAKVTRDRIMAQAERDYPAFTFAQHVGYPTPQHLRELRANGATPLHRRSFRPVAEMLEERSP